jgi:hypothetical protein
MIFFIVSVAKDLGYLFYEALLGWFYCWLFDFVKAVLNCENLSWKQFCK